MLRVVAVFCVLLQHATHTGPANHAELGTLPFTFVLSMGASTLMVISAYFACASLAKGRPGRFLRNRLARMMPAFAAAVVLTFLVQRWVAPEGWGQLDGRDVVFNILLLQAWLPDVRMVDFAYWTVPVQVVAFAAGALLCGRALGRGRALRLLLWALVAVPLIVRLGTFEPGPLRTASDGLGLHRAQLFAAGAAIWLWSRGRLGGPHLACLLTAAVVAQEIHSGELASTIGFGVLLLAVCLAAGGPDWDRPLLRALSRPITWLAGISYGVYLVHQEIGNVVMVRLAERGFTSWSLLAGFVGSAVLLGWLLTVLVERPAHRWLTGPQPAWLASAVLFSWVRPPLFRPGSVLARASVTGQRRTGRLLGAEPGRGPAQIQRGSGGSALPSAEPSPRPVSQASARSAEARTVSGIAVSPPNNSQVR
ncbi:Peptidoglycan/LPS O-acetylase OafA/YrhL, contains acyltransferase and SGNH-hydrolase domains [Goodfellowiella coeruleoviolacea]|uniref:Peptidoglycan/LPS O-acetylase OafA/YrhL, contains acyltransferase and SGNH-hydrolase domains n=1 Tax=Goodfellowiella coeruleoviolacea TaxID=334858 RepID=A0AAE3GHB2_9PSEU|nr:Peptidoglycan/LPS O-acetylase OafA/YrhL, contains acyltransferase and SGNH-hydrolase domains [Goodfellowiella coeruleoviolacea]